MSTVPGYILTTPSRQGHHMLTYRGYREADHTPVLIEILRTPSPTAHALAQLRHAYAPPRLWRADPPERRVSP